MKKKILAFGVLTTILSLTGNVYAAAQNSGMQGQKEPGGIHEPGTGLTNPELKDQNQGTGQGLQNENTATGTQTQQRLQDGSGDGNGVEAREQRRSMVSGAVQEMLRIGDRSGGIGEQVRVIAQNQNQNQEKVESSLQKVQSRSGFVKFLIGPNYGEINNAKKLLEQNREQIMVLNQIKNQLTDEGDGQKLMEQIRLFEQANVGIENSLEIERKGFSLFGWMFRMFSK